ncbi:MAG TPA: cytochrome c oxidase subunit II [Solirubrobacteraceae bacterium]|nr:cytochrome c oxidase subunit II [Solirubrobacteraceae bacterium]
MPAASWFSALALVDTRQQYYRLFDIYVPIAIGVFALIVVLALFAVLRFRRRPVEKAAVWHKNDRLEGAYALLLTLTVAFLLYLTFSAEHQVDTVANRQRAAVTIDVTAAKWEWTFFYPAYGITIRSGTSGVTPFVVPTGEPVRFNLRSVDVIHALWIYYTRYKHDAIPGSTQVFTLAFPHAGLFDGQCAEFCGLRHPDMLLAAKAVSPSAFAAWAHSHTGRSSG